MKRKSCIDLSLLFSGDGRDLVHCSLPAQRFGRVAHDPTSRTFFRFVRESTYDQAKKYTSISSLTISLPTSLIRSFYQLRSLSLFALSCVLSFPFAFPFLSLRSPALHLFSLHFQLANASPVSRRARVARHNPPCVTSIKVPAAASRSSARISGAIKPPQPAGGSPPPPRRLRSSRSRFRRVRRPRRTRWRGRGPSPFPAPWW